MQQVEDELQDYFETLREQQGYLEELNKKSQSEEEHVLRSDVRDFVMENVNPTINDVEQLLSSEQLNGSRETLRREYAELRTGIATEVYGSPKDDGSEGLIDEHDLPRHMFGYGGTTREKYARKSLGMETNLT
ncbi:MAG: hypothetical protein ABEJ99_02325 [Candidatus Nanohaloarchaea archaeon]